MRENRPYGSEGGEQRYCSPTPIGICAPGAPLLAWIPASAGTTMSLSLGKLQAPGFFAILRVSRMPYRPPRFALVRGPVLSNSNESLLGPLLVLVLLRIP